MARPGRRTTKREREVLLGEVSKYVLAGASIAEIAYAVDRSPREVQRIKAKLRERIQRERGEIMSEAREWEIFRLNQLLLAVWPSAKKGESKAHRAALDTLAQIRSVFTADDEQSQGSEAGQVAVLLQTFATLPQDEPITPREILERVMETAE